MLLVAFYAAAPASADSNGPFVILEAPGDGAFYYQGQQVQAAYACLAGPLGWPAITCDADAPLGSFLDTTNVGGHTGMSVDANEFALEMLRFPFRQVFGDPANEPSQPLVDVFRPKVSFATLEARFRAVIQP